jgi:hypothetical protein
MRERHSPTQPSASPTPNFGEPAIAVSFAFAKPGETVEDFQLRINSRGEWGRSKYGREKVELVLTRESVERLVEPLSSPNDRLSNQKGPRRPPL